MSNQVVKPTGRVAIDYNDVMKLRSCSMRPAQAYLTILRSSLEKRERGLITVWELAKYENIDLEQLLITLDLPYKKITNGQ